MYKEYIIIILVILLIVCLDVITNKYTTESIKIMSEDLNILKSNLTNKNNRNGENQLRKIKEDWEKRYNILAYYIEHDELEKVGTQLAGLSANLESCEYEQGLEKIDTTIFILKHIEDKEKFTVQSIF